LLLPQKEHSGFKRIGTDLFFEKSISLVDALCGECCLTDCAVSAGSDASSVLHAACHAATDCALPLMRLLCSMLPVTLCLRCVSEQLPLSCPPIHLLLLPSAAAAVLLFLG
jgi:hypothetical protein